jgi:hypothetical protein
LKSLNIHFFVSLIDLGSGTTLAPCIYYTTN